MIPLWAKKRNFFPEIVFFSLISWKRTVRDHRNFLQKDGSCLPGDYKPVNCAEFPYTARPDRWASLLGIVSNASTLRGLLIYMLIILTFQHFYMTKSEALTSDFVDSLTGSPSWWSCFVMQARSVCIPDFDIARMHWRGVRLVCFVKIRLGSGQIYLNILHFIIGAARSHPIWFFPMPPGHSCPQLPCFFLHGSGFRHLRYSRLHRPCPQ